MNDETELKKSVMQSIAAGKVKMRPRLHFVLLSLFLALGVLILLCALVYAVSLVVFFMHQSGAWFTPSFGTRGWFAFLRSLPWLLMLLLGAFVLLLEVLVRRYSFVYKKPLLVSALAVLAAVLFGGFAISQTPFHRQMAVYAQHGTLPPPLDGLYRPPFRLRSDDVFRGVIIATTSHGFVISDRGEGTSTVVIDPRTRLPYGMAFTVGDVVLVIGDMDDSDVVRAFGVRIVENVDSRGD
jgi:hypothetical protein